MIDYGNGFEKGGGTGGGARVVIIALLSVFVFKLALSGRLWVCADVGTSFIMQTSYCGDLSQLSGLCFVVGWMGGALREGGPAILRPCTRWGGWTECLGPFSRLVRGGLALGIR